MSYQRHVSMDPQRQRELAADRAAAPASERPLPVVAHLAARHSVDCARHDPDAGPCTCGAQPEPLVRLSDARAALADCAASSPQAVRRPLTEEHLDEHIGPFVWFTRKDVKAICRELESEHGIVPLAAQGTGGQ